VATDDDWASYARAVIDVVPPGGDGFRLVPADPGVVDPWPDDLVEPVVVVTAWNPDSVRLSPGDNVVRAKRLEAELVRLGVVHWPATGRDLATPHHEDGVAIIGLTEGEGIDLGARFGQAAVYSWTPYALSVVSCTDDRRHVSGWHLVGRPTLSG
jgi:hypothetical protein